MGRLKWCVFAVCCFLLTAMPAFAGTGLVKVSDHIYSYLDGKDGAANNFGANAGIIVGKRGIAVVDTLASAKAAEGFVRDIRAISDKPILYVIDTHSHFDHAFGNCVFRKLGAVIISQRQCDLALRQEGPSTLANIAAYGFTPEEMAGTTLAFPDITFTDELHLDLGDVTADLLYKGPTHTPGSIVVNVPEDKIVFAGDLLFTDFHVYMVDGDIPNWLKTLDYVESIGARKIIPGHGPLSMKQDVDDMKTYLVRFDSVASELNSHHYTLEKMVADMKASLPQRSRGEMLIGANLQGRYMTKEQGFKK